MDRSEEYGTQAVRDDTGLMDTYLDLCLARELTGSALNAEMQKFLRIGAEKPLADLALQQIQDEQPALVPVDAIASHDRAIQVAERPE